ncbi:MAG: hypothetical protein PHV34_18760 [Verrucomicrobiae bacterium]|nr:hypothetical protein [Verrucomicrobiae bacterium]
MSNMELYLDGNPLTLADSCDWTCFKAFCAACSAHLEPSGRVIHSISLDGKEVDCANPPTVNEILTSQKVEINSCLLKELVERSLHQQYDAATSLAAKFQDLSTDCLIDLPTEIFAKWKSGLETLKSLIGFIPHFVSLEALFNVSLPEFQESVLAKRIEDVQNAVDEARKALDNQDVVQFSDVLELKLSVWTKEHAALAEKLLHSKKD